jgi:IclR family acetate operon transcriptional repressor
MSGSIPIEAGGVQALARALDLLEHMAKASEGSSLSHLSEVSGLPGPTTHRLLRTLVQRGYVRQLPSRRYALGPCCISLAERATQLMGSWARPHLERLVDGSGETANMAMLDGNFAVYVAQVPSRYSVRMFIEVGRRAYPHASGVGKAILSQLSEQAVRDIIGRIGMPPLTDRSMQHIDELLVELQRIRARGYAVDDGEQEVGVRCLAVPVPLTSSPVAISISGPASRVTLEKAPVIVPLLQSVAVALGAELAGHKDQAAPATGKPA